MSESLDPDTSLRSSVSPTSRGENTAASSSQPSSIMDTLPFTREEYKTALTYLIADWYAEVPLSRRLTGPSRFKPFEAICALGPDVEGKPPFHFGRAIQFQSQCTGCKVPFKWEEDQVCVDPRSGAWAHSTSLCQLSVPNASGAWLTLSGFRAGRCTTSSCLQPFEEGETILCVAEGYRHMTKGTEMLETCDAPGNEIQQVGLPNLCVSVVESTPEDIGTSM